MRFFKFVFLFLLISSTLLACKKDAVKKKNTVIKKEVAHNLPQKLEKMEFHIKGMTCEIGCARLIQSKLSKTDGIVFTKVSFKDSLGMVEFDRNKLSTKDINNVVESIADGSLYKVSDNKTVSEFKKLK